MAASLDVLTCKACHHPRPSGSAQSSAVVACAALQESSTTCSTCSVICRGVRAIVDDTQWSGWLRLDFSQAVSYKGIDVLLFDSKIAISAFSLSKSPTVLALLPDLPLGHIVPHSTASSETLSWIKKKITSCDEKHDCHRQQAKQTSPTRLLCIKDGVRLTQKIGEAVRYACLSHCWGGSTPAQTLSANVYEHLESIPWSSLPLTFQDTIHLVRALGIDYLWIDSLCIIQDDDLDWRREAASMTEIYQNAYLVVSAASAQNAHGGLYTSVDSSFEPVAIELDDCDEKVYFQKSLSHISSFMDRRLNIPAKLPTLARAWILQERLLASRVLHFGPHEVMWECLCESACQCREPLSVSDLHDNIRHVSRLKEYFSPRNWRLQSHQSLIKSWHRLIQDYTLLNITYEKDVLPALSGIAKAFQRARKSKYVAGLWETSLLEDLLWNVAVTSDRSQSSEPWSDRLKEWRAPSWSWASAGYPVNFVDIHEGLQPFASVVDTSVTLAGSDPTGEITDAHLCVKGYLVPTKIEHVDVGSAQRMPWNTMTLQVLSGAVTNTWVDYDCTLSGPGYLEPGIEIQCLLIGETIASPSLLVLILKRQGADYQRIGLAQVMRPPNSDTGLTSWLRSLAQDNDQGEQLVKII